MPSKKTKLSKKEIDEIQDAYIKSKTYKEFRIKHPLLYKKSLESGFINQLLLKHGDKRSYARGVWKEKKNILNEANKYKTISEFIKKAPGAYKGAQKLGILEDVKKILKPKIKRRDYFTRQEIKKKAFACKDYKQFRLKYPHEYSHSRYFEGLRDEIKKKLYSPKLPGYWSSNKSRIQSEANKYKTRMEFWRNSGPAYNAAKNNKWLDEVCSHMKVVGNKHSRAIYVFEFGNKLAYVGLTYNYEERYQSHMKKNKKIIKATEEYGHEFIMYNEWLSPGEAAKEERRVLAKYRKEGWIMLNSTSAGGLGGIDKKYQTKKEVLEAAKNYKSRSEFRKKDAAGYNKARRGGYLDQACKHMKSHSKWVNSITKKEIMKLSKNFETIKEFKNSYPSHYWKAKKMSWDRQIVLYYESKREKWTKKRIIEVAKNCNSRSEFYSSAARIHAEKKGILKGVLKYVQIKIAVNPRKKPLEAIQKAAKECKTRKEFRERYAGEYQAAHKRGLLDEICSHMEYIQLPSDYWSEKKIIALAKKCKTTKEFRETYPKAYEWARSHDILEQVKQYLIITKKRNGYWDEAAIKKEISNYSTLKEFRENSPSCYSSMKKLGLYHLTEVLNKGHKVFWNEDRLNGVIKKYKSYKNFKAKEKKAYDAVKSKGYWHLVEHFPDRVVRQKWTEEKLINLKKQYETLQDFRKNEPKAYDYARKNGKMHLLKDLMKVS